MERSNQKKERVSPRTERQLVWDSKTVMENLGVSQPTAYKLMKDSGALLRRIPRRKRVLASEFLEYLLGEEDEKGEKSD